MRNFIAFSSLICLVGLLAQCTSGPEYTQPNVEGRNAEIITVGKYQFKDLNKNGELDPYEDWRLSADDRITNLVSLMTLEEKVGLLCHPNMAVPEDGIVKYDLTDEEKEALARAQDEVYAGPIGPGGQQAQGGGMGMGQMRRSATAKEYIEEKNFRNILNNGVASPDKFAEWSNDMQEIAEGTRLGIPVMFSTDPRHGATLGAHVSGTQYFSQWPSREGQVGITASRDTNLVRSFGEVTAEEYRAVGLHMILGPQIDVITEPRWSRDMGCFSEDANLTAAMLAAYMDGAQGENVGPDKILVHLKHWPGAGPHEDGTGNFTIYPGDNLDYHLIPWREGIAKGALAVMGYYSGTYVDTLNVNYSPYWSTEVLYNQLGFQGAICTDWGVVGRGPLNPRLQGTTTKDNIGMIINAGVDQMGNETNTQYILELVNEGTVSEDRINTAAKRILQWHFALGLFEDPYVDSQVATQILQSEKNQALGYEAQLESVTLLTNDGVLPASEQIKLYVDGVDQTIAAEYATIVDDPSDADLILVRTTTQAERGAGGFGAQGGEQTEVNIDFPQEKWDNIKSLAATGVPVVVAFNPSGSNTVLPSDLKQVLKGTLITFDVLDNVLLDVVFGKFNPVGKLPFELPSSMQAVRDQLEDVPFDSKDPLFSYDYGLSYE